MDPFPPPLLAFTEQAPLPVCAFARPHVVTRVVPETRGPRRPSLCVSHSSRRGGGTRSGGVPRDCGMSEKVRRRPSRAQWPSASMRPDGDSIFGLKRERGKP